MSGTATVIVLTAGGMTFTNQWYQTHKLDWKVPVATVLLAGAVDLLSDLDNSAAIMIASLIFLGAATTKFNGKSPVDMITGLVNSKTPVQKAKG